MESWQQKFILMDTVWRKKEISCGMQGNRSIEAKIQDKKNVNSSPPRQNGPYLADDVFKYIFVNEIFCISIKISLTFVPKGPIDNMQVLVRILALHRTGDNPLTEPVLVRFTDAYMRH